MNDILVLAEPEGSKCEVNVALEFAKLKISKLQIFRYAFAETAITAITPHER